MHALSNYEYTKMAKFKPDFTQLSVCLLTDNTGVSQQMVFIPGQAFHPFFHHIFEILQGHTQTHKLTTITLKG